MCERRLFCPLLMMRRCLALHHASGVPCDRSARLWFNVTMVASIIPKTNKEEGGLGLVLAPPGVPPPKVI